MIDENESTLSLAWMQSSFLLLALSLASLDTRAFFKRKTLIMKKQIASTLPTRIRKSLLRIGLASLLTFSFAPVMHAQDEKPGSSAVSISYAGMIENKPVFLVEFENTTGEAVTVSLKDDQGNVFYSERFRERKFSKKFQLDRDDLDNVKLTFVLATARERQAQSFELNTRTRTIQDVVVNKL